MSNEQRFTIARYQLALLFAAMLIIGGLAMDKALPGGAIEVLLGSVLTHAGMTAYNGATKAEKAASPSPPPSSSQL